RYALVTWRGTTTRPMGYAMREAKFVMKLVAAEMTVDAISVSSITRGWGRTAITAGCPTAALAPETSRKASSMLSGSTRGVTSWKMRCTSAEYVVYFSKWGSSTETFGNRERARARVVAERMPYRLAG